MRSRAHLLLFLSILLLMSSLGCRLVASIFQPDQPVQPIQPVEIPPPNDQLPEPLIEPENLPDPELPVDFQLAGIWEAEVDTGYGSTLYFELILEHTGTFSQQVLLGDLMTYDVGTYVVGDGFIHFMVENHEPKVYKGKDMTWVNSFTYFYTVVDGDTLTFEDHIQDSTWTVYRR